MSSPLKLIHVGHGRGDAAGLVAVRRTPLGFLGALRQRGFRVVKQRRVVWLARDNAIFVPEFARILVDYVSPNLSRDDLVLCLDRCVEDPGLQRLLESTALLGRGPNVLAPNGGTTFELRLLTRDALFDLLGIQRG
jgi:hypothetical protein